MAVSQASCQQHVSPVQLLLDQTESLGFSRARFLN